jgi:MFS family permease
MGLKLAMMGLGSLLGALFVASIGKGKRGLILIGGSFLTGVALMLTATIPIYFAAVGVMVLLGLGDAGRRTLNQALIMEDTEDAYRGRVMSLFMMNFGLMPLSILPAGIATQYLGGQWTIGIMAGMLLAFSAVILITQKQLRNTP